MKKYNKPVVEIKGFEVEDIITTSIFANGNQEMQAVYRNFVNGETNTSDQLVIIQW